jgi:hypothetical protein
MSCEQEAVAHGLLRLLYTVDSISMVGLLSAVPIVEGTGLDKLKGNSSRRRVTAL